MMSTVVDIIAAACRGGRSLRHGPQPDALPPEWTEAGRHRLLDAWPIAARRPQMQLTAREIVEAREWGRGRTRDDDLADVAHHRHGEIDLDGAALPHPAAKWRTKNLVPRCYAVWKVIRPDPVFENLLAAPRLVFSLGILCLRYI